MAPSYISAMKRVRILVPKELYEEIEEHNVDVEEAIRIFLKRKSS